MITPVRAEKLRQYVETLANETSELDDLLGTLEDADLKGEEREEAQEEFISILNGLREPLDELINTVGKML